MGDAVRIFHAYYTKVHQRNLLAMSIYVEASDVTIAERLADRAFRSRFPEAKTPHTKTLNFASAVPPGGPVIRQGFWGQITERLRR